MNRLKSFSKDSNKRGQPVRKYWLSFIFLFYRFWKCYSVIPNQKCSGFLFRPRLFFLGVKKNIFPEIYPHHFLCKAQQQIFDAFTNKLSSLSTITSSLPKAIFPIEKVLSSSQKPSCILTMYKGL